MKVADDAWLENR